MINPLWWYSKYSVVEPKPIQQLLVWRYTGADPRFVEVAGFLRNLQF